VPNDVTTRRTVTDALTQRIAILENLMAAMDAIADTQTRVNAETVAALQSFSRRLDVIENWIRHRLELLERGQMKDFQ
jgi:hypothetical protein